MVLDNEKLIEEIARVNCQTAKYVKVPCDECILNKPCKWIEEAEALLPLIKQYQEQAVKEFAEKLKEKGMAGKLKGVKDIDETLKEVIGEKR